MSVNEVVISEKKTNKKGIIVAGIVGNVLEWFDYSLYGFFASAISINFFPAEDPMVSLLLSFLVFGLGFLARPFGGLVFGYFGDKIGRKNTLSITVILMGISTCLIGFLPTYAQIGIAAPVILIVVRLMQGIAAGGEWGSCVSFLGEYSKPNNRAFIVSFSMVGAALGLLLGATLGLILSSALPKESLLSWGWRPAFLFGIIVALFGYFMRQGVEETPIFKEKMESNTLSKNPLRDAFKGYKKEMIIVFLVMGGSMVTYWLILSFMATYISRFLKLPISTGFSLTVITLSAHMITLPISGYLADKIGRKPLLLIGSSGIVLLSYPLFNVLAHATTYGSMASVVAALAFIYSLFAGTLPSALSELFPASVRVSGYSVPYQFASAVFGGTAMAVVTWLMSKTQNVMVVPLYMCAMMFVALVIIIFFYKETKDNPYE